MTPRPASLGDAFASLTFLPDRAPGSDKPPGWAARVAEYRDGAVFIVHYAGSSEWERHPVGDEFVMVVEGESTMTLIVDGEEQQHTLTSQEFIVVPENTWHRFDTPDGAKIMTITPQPTDHSLEHPGAS